MKLSSEAIMEFREIYKAEYGKELAMADSETMAAELISLYQLISPYRPP